MTSPPNPNSNTGKDGIELLLGLGGVEAKLALKGKAVTPYHLRLALQSADPGLAEIAAKHPGMTAELIAEVLSGSLSGGDNKALRDIVLSRRDLTVEHLKQVAHHPDHQFQVANHPGTTDDIRQSVLDGNVLPEVKQLHLAALKKNIGHLTFPLLGEGKVYSTPMYANAGQIKVREKYLKVTPPKPKDADKNKGIKDFKQTGSMRFSANKDTSAGMPFKRRKVSGWVTDQPVTGAGDQSSIDAGKAFNAMSGHEAQHSVFGRLAQKHGTDAVHRILTTAFSKLPEDHRNAINAVFQSHGAVTGNPMIDPEESIAYLHNYLQSPTFRNNVHKKLGFTTPEEGQDAFQEVHRAWKGLRKIGLSLKPDEVGIDPTVETAKWDAWRKKEHPKDNPPPVPKQLAEQLDKAERHGVNRTPNRVSNEYNGLAGEEPIKRESIPSQPSDQLGFSVSFHELISAAEFLTGKKVDLQTVKRALKVTDGDPVKAVLRAFSVDTEEGLVSFENVRLLLREKHKAMFGKLPDLYKADSVASNMLHPNEKNPDRYNRSTVAPKMIHPIEPVPVPGLIRDLDGPDMPHKAEIVLDAFNNGRVVTVELGGKHSHGTFLVEDKEHNTCILKPGSDKNSPAAGISEVDASQSRREAIFYHIAKALSIEEVKPVYLLEIDGKEVAMLEMWPHDYINLHRATHEDVNLPRTALEKYRLDGRLFKWAVLDGICTNVDRHGNNLLIGPAAQGNRIGLIDHGSSFAGPSFNPHDEDTFIPYYLRVFCRGDVPFMTMSPGEQLKEMPIVTGEADDNLRHWLGSIDSKEVSDALIRYGMDPELVLTRLKEFKALVGIRKSASQAINEWWVTG